MIESLVITLREGIEAALVVAIILAYLRKTGSPAMARYVYGGLALAILASGGIAFAFQMLGIDPENPLVEGVMLGVAGLFVATMVVWMRRTARNIKGEMESRLSVIVKSNAETTKLGGRGIGLATFTFFMVLREGIEMVLFLAAATIGGLNGMSLLGILSGVALAVVFAVFFIRGSIRINLGLFFNVTSLVLLVLAARLILASVHEFAEIHVIPLSEEVTDFLGVISTDSITTVVFALLLALPLVLILWEKFGHRGLPRPVNR